MAIKYTNNASATLASSITSGATSISVTSGQGALFPSLTGSDYFYATLSNSSNVLEIVKCTARTGDVLTVVRGQDGTTANAYNSGDKIELRPTAGGFNDIQAQITALASGPSFSAYASAAGSNVATATFTKFLFDSKNWDTNNNFASSRFTPTVAGTYQINASCQIGSVAPGFISIYKNGNEYKRGAWPQSASEFAVSGLVQCNGTTDYIEIYIYQTSGGNVVPQGGATVSWFDGALIRSV